MPVELGGVHGVPGEPATGFSTFSPHETHAALSLTQGVHLWYKRNMKGILPVDTIRPYELSDGVEYVKMRIVPISFSEANLFVTLWHRHHKPCVGHKFSIAVADYDGTVHGVVIVGRPVARKLDNGWTLEVNRCCSDGTRNACSMLYGAAWRAAKALGYVRLITYTLEDEGGASLRGTGWKLVGTRGGGNWNVPSRPRIDTDVHLQGQKLLCEAA